MEPSEILAHLGRFGLTDREARLYLAALRHGRATARQLAREAGVDRVLGYRLLDGMRTRGLMDITADRPRRYTPVPVESLIDRNLRGRTGALREDEEAGRTLVQHLAALTPAERTGAPRYQLLTGSDPIYDYLQEMVGRATRQIEVLLTFRSLRASVERGLPGRIGPFIARGGRVRLLIESDPRLAPTLLRLRRGIRRFQDSEIRELRPQPTRLTIVDGSEALLFLVPEAKDRHSAEVAVWTDNPAFVSGQSMFFESLWAMSPPDPRSRRPGRPARTPVARSIPRP
jgi:sugar-specific transcriptional regulator TrmB